MAEAVAVIDRVHPALENAGMRVNMRFPGKNTERKSNSAPEHAEWRESASFVDQLLRVFCMFGSDST